MKRIKMWIDRYQYRKELKEKRASLQLILRRGEKILIMGKNMEKGPSLDDFCAMEKTLEELREKIACISAQIKEV